MSNLDYNYIAQLVLKAQRGDSNAFAEFYAATYQKQYRFACTYLKDSYLAQDAVQEIFILAFKNIRKLKEPTLAVAWLNQIAFRVCYNMQKKQKRYDEEMNEYNAEGFEANLKANSSPEQDVVEIDEKEYLLTQVMKLPLSESQAIILKYYKNMKLDEIADVLDISKSSVKRYLKSGREHLASILQV